MKQEKVIRSQRNGGNGKVWIERFFVLRYVSMCVKLSKKDSLADCMVRYAAGSVLRKWKLEYVDLRRHVCFGALWFYMRIERSIRKFSLQVSEV